MSESVLTMPDSSSTLDNLSGSISEFGSNDLPLMSDLSDSSMPQVGGTSADQNDASNYKQGQFPKTGEKSSVGTSILGAGLVGSGLLLAKNKNKKRSKKKS
jgi:LPXTG-motif cell wall-anchored protein